MARVLIVGCGCRGLALARELIADGHAVRATTRDPGRVAEIEAVGVEAVVGDPDVVATLARALEHVSVACILLGSATGSPDRLAALHGTRLQMLLTRMLDTTVRGIVYEAAGSVDRGLLEAGAAQCARDARMSRIPYALLDTDPTDWAAWTSAAVDAVERVLAPR